MSTNPSTISRFPGGGTWNSGRIDLRPEFTEFRVTFQYGLPHDRSAAFAVIEIDRSENWHVHHFEARINGRMIDIGKGHKEFSDMMKAFDHALWEDDKIIARGMQAALRTQQRLAATRHWSYQKPVHAIWLRVYKAEIAKIAADTL